MIKIYFIFLLNLLIPFSAVHAADINQCGTYAIKGTIERVANNLQLQLYSKTADELDLKLTGDQALRAIAYEKFHVKVIGVISKAVIRRQGEILVQKFDLANYRPDRVNGGDEAKLLKASPCVAPSQAKSK